MSLVLSYVTRFHWHCDEIYNFYFNGRYSTYIVLSYVPLIVLSHVPCLYCNVSRVQSVRKILLHSARSFVGSKNDMPTRLGSTPLFMQVYFISKLRRSGAALWIHLCSTRFTPFLIAKEGVPLWIHLFSSRFTPFLTKAMTHSHILCLFDVSEDMFSAQSMHR